MIIPIYENICIPGEKLNSEYLKKFKYYIMILWIQSNAEVWNKVDEYILYKYGFSLSHNLC